MKTRLRVERQRLHVHPDLLRAERLQQRRARIVLRRQIVDFEETNRTWEETAATAQQRGSKGSEQGIHLQIDGLLALGRRLRERHDAGHGQRGAARAHVVVQHVRVVQAGGGAHVHVRPQRARVRLVLRLVLRGQKAASCQAAMSPSRSGVASPVHHALPFAAREWNARLQVRRQPLDQQDVTTHPLCNCGAILFRRSQIAIQRQVRLHAHRAGVDHLPLLLHVLLDGRAHGT